MNRQAMYVDKDVPEQMEAFVAGTGTKVESSKDEKKKGEFWSNMTIEPMWFGVTISFSMGFIAFKNLYLERACLVDLGYSYEKCFHSMGAEKAAIELEAQRIVSSLSVLSGFVGGFITCILLIFLGPWSDNSGRRKPLILLPLVGMVMCSTSQLTIQAFPHLSTVYVIYAEVIPLCLGGNFALLVMSSFSYLGDICYKTGKCATTVMGNNTAFITLFIVVGSLLAPVVYRTIGFVGMFSLSIVLEFTSLSYAYFKIHDVNVAKEVPSIFDLTLPLQSLKNIFKKRDGNRRLIVLLMVLIPCNHSITFINEGAITYLYTRNKFAWTELEFSIYEASKNTIQVIGSFTIVYVLKKKLLMRDELIGFLGALSMMAASSMLLLSFHPSMLFVANIMGFLSRGVMIAERPVLNKQITANEQGKVNSITAVLEKCTAFVINPLSNYIYVNSLSIFPSSYALVSVIACIVQLICYGIVLCMPKEEDLREMGTKQEKEKLSNA